MLEIEGPITVLAKRTGYCKIALAVDPPSRMLYFKVLTYSLCSVLDSCLHGCTLFFRAMKANHVGKCEASGINSVDMLP